MLAHGPHGRRTALAFLGRAPQLYVSAARFYAHFADEYDFVFIHDPQPAALLEFAGKGRARWI